MKRENKQKIRKKDMKFPNLGSLQSIVNLLNEAAIGLSDKTRSIKDSPLKEVLGGALGAGIGGVISFAALYAAGTVGLSAAGITSGLAVAGAVIGGGMVAGIFVLAAPVAVLAGVGVGVMSRLRQIQLQQEKERLYQEVLIRHQQVIEELKNTVAKDQERIDYLNSLNILLQQALKDLQKDLGIV